MVGFGACRPQIIASGPGGPVTTQVCDSKGGSDSGAIIGAVAGGVALLALGAWALSRGGEEEAEAQSFLPTRRLSHQPTFSADGRGHYAIGWQFTW